MVKPGTLIGFRPELLNFELVQFSCGFTLHSINSLAIHQPKRSMTPCLRRLGKAEQFSKTKEI
jgi:hypothetical protein